jgi:hypothetical protein
LSRTSDNPSSENSFWVIAQVPLDSQFMVRRVRAILAQ